MAKPYCYEYPRPSLTVDLAAFALDGGALRVLLVRRKGDPFAGRLALPGGFVGIDEPVETAARRELREETGVAFDGPLGFVGAFADPGRDPRGRTVSLAHAAALGGPPPEAKGADDAESAGWFDPFSVDPGNLAFDHRAILDAALRWLVDGGAVAWLPGGFTDADAAKLAPALRVGGTVSAWLERLAALGVRGRS